jgi:hypothetical protein
MPKEVLHKQCFGRIRRCYCMGENVEDPIMSDDGKSDE